MQVLGFVLVALALVGAVFGLIQHSRAKKILAAPFRRTGEIAQNPGVADPKAGVSCEGQIVVHQPMLAPCSQRPCVYFEVEVTRHWQKSSMTENGAKTEKGKSRVTKDSGGTPFGLDDGSGAVGVDPRKGLEGDLVQSFDQAQNIAYGDVVVGQYRATIPATMGSERTTHVTITERILEPGGPLFAMGKLEHGHLTKPDGMMGTLRTSRKGRDALLGATKRNRTIGLAAAGVMMLPGLGLSIFGKPLETGPNACAIVDATKPDAPCRGSITSDDGTTVTATITKAGTYAFRAHAPKGKKVPLMAVLTVKDASGKVVVDDEHEEATAELEPGTYSVNVRDAQKGSTKTFKGGFSFELEVDQTAVAADPEPAPAAQAEHDEPEPKVKPAAAIAPTPKAQPAKASVDKPSAQKAAAKPAASAAPAPAAVKPAASAAPKTP